MEVELLSISSGSFLGDEMDMEVESFCVSCGFGTILSSKMYVEVESIFSLSVFSFFTEKMYVEMHSRGIKSTVLAKEMYMQVEFLSISHS